MVSGKDVAVRGRHVHLALDIRTSTVPPSAMPSLESTVFSEPLFRQLLESVLQEFSRPPHHVCTPTTVSAWLLAPGSKEENTSLLTPLFDPIARGLFTAALMDFRSPISDK